MIAGKSVVLIAMFFPNKRVPAFPGAINSSSNIELCAIFHANAFSLPPEPRSNTLMLIVAFSNILKGIQKLIYRLRLQ